MPKYDEIDRPTPQEKRARRSATDLASDPTAIGQIADTDILSKAEADALYVAKAAGTGIATLLSAGLGASISYTKSKNNTTDLLAGHATKARAVLIVVVVDEVMATGTGTQPTFKIGEESGADDKFAGTAAFAGKAAGTVLVFGGTQSANKKIQVTGTTFVGNGTGGITVTVIGIPTT